MCGSCQDLYKRCHSSPIAVVGVKHTVQIDNLIDDVHQTEKKNIDSCFDCQTEKKNIDSCFDCQTEKKNIDSFLIVEGVKSSEIICRMQAHYINNYLSRSNTWQWIQLFKYDLQSRDIFSNSGFRDEIIQVTVYGILGFQDLEASNPAFKHGRASLCDD
ncbi:hypothetical protein TNCV_204451 [Trichonephila clavipes]|nr:hypothetical protein TNCV_204451 [Trichonephila clavipes]